MATETETCELHDLSVTCENAELKQESEPPTPRGDDEDINNSNTHFENQHGCLKSLWLWYIAPVSYDLKYSFGAILYQFLNFLLAWLLFSYVVAAYTVAITSLIFIIGIVVFWWVLELSMIFAKLDLYMTILLVEHDKELRSARNALRLSLDSRRIPPCGFSVVASWQRLKFLITSCSTYGMIIYQGLVKVGFSMVFGWGVIIAVYILGMIFIPIWYLSDVKFFRHNKICIFGNSGDHDGGRCYGLRVDDFGSALGVCILGFLLLPIAFHFNNACCYVQKVITYYFLTEYYADSQIDFQSLLNKKSGSGSQQENTVSKYPQYTVNSGIEV